MTSLPPAGQHGGDGARVAAALGLEPAAVLDLSASLNPVAPDPSRFVAEHLDALGRYPDAGPATRALAGAIGVAPDNVLLSNGGAEAIALVAEELGRGWADPCEFALYRRHLPELDAGGARFRSDPHNPTGLLAGPEQAAAVWDEAFYPLATGRWTRPGRPLVVGSLTKLFACPGLRVGYVLADDPELVARLGRRQPRWAVNGLACAALPALLETADLTAWAAQVAELRAALVALLAEHGLDPGPSHANYVLCARAEGLRGRLARHGVVVRDCASFGLPGQARVAVPDEAGLRRLRQALEESSCAAG